MAKHVSQDKNFNVWGDGVETTPDDVVVSAKGKSMSMGFAEDGVCKPLDNEAGKYDLMKLMLLKYDDDYDEEEEEKLEVDKEMLMILKDDEEVGEGEGEGVEPMILTDEHCRRHVIENWRLEK
ncbi:hypothetical protein Lser_V15G29495 [Lactuca serriola]